VAALFSVIRRLLALKFVEEGELGAGNVLHLFAEAASIFELSGCGDEGILVLRDSLSDAEKIPFCELKGAANAFCDGLGNVVLLSGLLGGGVLWRPRFRDSSQSDATGDKKGGDTKKSHPILLDWKKDIRSSREKSNASASFCY
jgi:hypothetical protein